ncbi:MAG: hypothetical protein GC145_06280 [Caulobacter sp.]|nr:hypothetical protein [Caulobacter sp.]
MRPRGGPATVSAWASAARDVLALLFTPVATLICIWLICILAYGAWAADTQALRIQFLGGLAILFAILVGLGGQWFQRNRLEKLKVTGPGGFSGEIDTDADPARPPDVAITTTTEIKG